MSPFPFPSTVTIFPSNTSYILYWLLSYMSLDNLIHTKSPVFCAKTTTNLSLWNINLFSNLLSLFCLDILQDLLYGAPNKT